MNKKFESKGILFQKSKFSKFELTKTKKYEE